MFIEYERLYTDYTTLWSPMNNMSCVFIRDLTTGIQHSRQPVASARRCPYATSPIQPQTAGHVQVTFYMIPGDVTNAATNKPVVYDTGSML